MIARLFFALTLVFCVSAHALKSGEAAPDFTLKGADGKEFNLAKAKGKNVVLEWFNKDCPYVRKHYDTKNMQKMQAEATSQGTEWYMIVSSAKGKEGEMDAAAASKYKTEKGVAATNILFDTDGKVGKLYGAKTTPHMFVIDKKGLLAYQGAIDDQPSANEKTVAGAQSYVKMALGSMAKGEAIKTASTPSYGCSVKY